MNAKKIKFMSRMLIVLFVAMSITTSVTAGVSKDGWVSISIFDMPEFDMIVNYTYNTTQDTDVPVRVGKDAILQWGEETTIGGKEYSVSKLIKYGGGEIQYLGLEDENEDITLKRIVDWNGSITFMNLTFDPESLFIDYPLWVGKTWNREEVNFSGTVWMGRSVPISGSTWGLGSVVDEEDVMVPAGVVQSLVIETSMTSIIGNIEQVNIQKIWMMENGLFAKRQLYHGDTLIEELVLKEPILAKINFKPGNINHHSKGILTAFIELPYDFDIADIDLSTVKCNKAQAIDGHIVDNKLIVKFNTQDIDEANEDRDLLTITGRFNDNVSFEGFETIRVIQK